MLFVELRIFKSYWRLLLFVSAVSSACMSALCAPGYVLIDMSELNKRPFGHNGTCGMCIQRLCEGLVSVEGAVT